jgi:diguanylate cyclase (GGDEF)-like protein
MRGAVKMDFLTGTITRRQIDKAVTQEWLRSARTAAPLTLLIADIDGFSAYNAEFGEDKGDVCLRLVADALRASTHRTPDLLARYAGGQFALLLPETGVAGGRAVAQRAIESVESLQLMHATSLGCDRVSLRVGGGYCDSARGSGVKAAEAAVPDDLRLAAERGLEIARVADDREARFVDVAHLSAARGS